MKTKTLLFIIFLSVNFSFAQELRSVIIGNQIWSSNNLAVQCFRNGDTIMEAKTNESWIKANKEGKPAWCYYNNDSLSGAIYGKLYNWYAVHDSRDLAPTGWRIPYAEDYVLLARYHEINQYFMKSDSQWAKVGNPELELYDGNGNNKFGFNGIPGGNRGVDGEFKSVGYYTGFWSLSSYDSLTAWNLNLSGSNNGPPLSTEYPKTYGLSIRLVKDDGVRKSNDINDKLRKEIESDLLENKYDTVIQKLKIICFRNNGFVYHTDYIKLMNCYLKNKELILADSIFNKALKLFQDNEKELYNDFAWNLISNKYYTTAVNYLKTANEKDNNDIYLKCNLAHAYLLSGQFEEAKQIYLRNAILSDTLVTEDENNPGTMFFIPTSNDTTWINMVSNDFNYFKKNGVKCNDFIKIINLIKLEIIIHGQNIENSAIESEDLNKDGKNDIYDLVYSIKDSIYAEGGEYFVIARIIKHPKYDGLAIQLSEAHDIYLLDPTSNSSVPNIKENRSVILLSGNLVDKTKYFNKDVILKGSFISGNTQTYIDGLFFNVIGIIGLIK